MASLVSRQALAASTNALLTAAATMDEAALTVLADDLAGVARVLAGQPHLRRMLTETTVEAESKVGLTQRLFSDKVSEASLRLVGKAVGLRWQKGSDLADGLRRLARTALFLQAERTGELDEIEEQLFRFGRIIDANPDLALILDDPITPGAARAELVERLLEGKAHRLTVDLLTELARHLGGRTYSYGVADLVKQAAERRDKLVAIVTSAATLSTNEIDRLRAALAKIYSREIVVHVVVDSALGGGLRVRVGDEVIDGSIAGRLNTIRERLTR